MVLPSRAAWCLQMQVPHGDIVRAHQQVFQLFEGDDGRLCRFPCPRPLSCPGAYDSIGGGSADVMSSSYPWHNLVRSMAIFLCVHPLFPALAGTPVMPGTKGQGFIQLSCRPVRGCGSAPCRPSFQAGLRVFSGLWRAGFRLSLPG